MCFGSPNHRCKDGITPSTPSLIDDDHFLNVSQSTQSFWSTVVWVTRVRKKRISIYMTEPSKQEPKKKKHTDHNKGTY